MLTFYIAYIKILKGDIQMYRDLLSTDASFIDLYVITLYIGNKERLYI